jgi:ribonuclease H2 subunit A
MKRFNSKLPTGEDALAKFKEGVVIGVDEAGRGPVLGPMVYGVAFWSVEDDPKRGDGKFDDSKKLTEEVRAGLYAHMCAPEVPIGFITGELSAQLLSEQMMQVPLPVSLNKIAWDLTVELLHMVHAYGFPVKGELCWDRVLFIGSAIAEPI